MYKRQGTAASRPTAGTVGRVYITTDTLGIYYDTGSVWNLIVDPALTGDCTASAGSTVTTVGSIGGKAVVLGGSLTTSGAYPTTLTMTGTTSLTLPTSGTLLTNSLASTNIFVGNGSGVATGVALSGDATLANTGALTLATSGVTAASYGSASSVATFTVDAKGRLTTAASTSIAIAASQVTSGQLAIAQGGTGAATTSQGFVFVGPVSGSGAPSFRALTVSDLPASVVGGMNYQGLWNATTNSPSITTASASTVNKGWYYKVSVAGSTTVDGLSQWNVGDLIVSDGTTWDKVDGLASEVVSVSGTAGQITTSSTIGSLTVGLASVTQGSTGTSFVKVALDGYGRVTNNTAVALSDLTGLGALSNSLTSANIFVGNGSNVATGVALSGDATISNAGALTLATVNSNTGAFGSANTVPVITTNGKGLVTAVSTATISQSSITTRKTVTASYSVLTTDYIVGVNASAAATITLPAVAANLTFVIKDESGAAGTNNITIATTGTGVNIDGQATVVMNLNYQSVSLYCTGTQWFII